MNRRLRLILRVFAFIAGLILILIGAALIYGYIWGAIIEPWGNPDQSLIYWLSFMPGLAAIITPMGVVLINWARSK